MCVSLPLALPLDLLPDEEAPFEFLSATFDYLTSSVFTTAWNLTNVAGNVLYRNERIISDEAAAREKVKMIPGIYRSQDKIFLKAKDVFNFLDKIDTLVVSLKKDVDEANKELNSLDPEIEVLAQLKQSFEDRIAVINNYLAESKSISLPYTGSSSGGLNLTVGSYCTRLEQDCAALDAQKECLIARINSLQTLNENDELC